MKKVNMNTIAKAVCDKEGKKKEVSIAQIKEILGIFADMIWSDPRVLLTFMGYAGKRSLKRRR